MNLSRARVARLLRLIRKHPKTLKHVALEGAWWAIPSAGVRPLPLSWSLPADMLAKTIIRWPKRVLLPDAHLWEPKLRAALATHVRLQPTTIDHAFTSILMFDVVIGGRSHRIAVDYRDTNEVPDDCVASVALYFKLQFSNQGYPYEHVVPGGYLVGRQKYYRYLPRLRALSGRDPLFDVYGRFGPRGETLRRKVAAQLREQNRFQYTGGVGTVIYSQFLSEVARARISLDLPGYGWLCYRLVEYLGIGACVVAIPHGNRLHVPLVDGEHVVYTRADGEDVVDLCAYYLEHDSERKAIARNAQDYFDRYMHYRQLGAYYISMMFQRFR